MQLNQYLIYLLYMDLGNPAFDYQSEHVFAMKSNAHLPFCNRVCGTLETSITEIEQVRRFFDTTPFRWFVNKNDTDLISKIESAGFQHKVSYPAMHLKLQNIKHETYAQDISVKKITLNSLHVWLSIVAPSYNTNQNEFSRFINYLIQRAFSDTLHFFIGYYQNKPVACSMIIDHPEVAGLHWVGTLSEYRNKGLGYAISHAALLDAQERGLSHAILFASEQGKPVYEKIGFSQYAMYNVYGLN